MVKLEMILEREKFMTVAQKKDKEWFPHYIIVRKLAEGSNENEDQDPIKELCRKVDELANQMTQVLNLQQQKAP